MTNMFQMNTGFAFGLLALCGACSDESGSPEDTGLSAEQACLRANTNEGRFKFYDRTECQVCGADRQEFQASLRTSSVIALPKQRSGLSFDFSLIAVRLADRFGGYVELNRVTAGTPCGNAQSFQFDDDHQPTVIKLCNCDSTVKVSGAEYVDLLVGCKAGGTTGTVTGTPPTGQCGCTGSSTVCGGGGSGGSTSTYGCGCGSTACNAGGGSTSTSGYGGSSNRWSGYGASTSTYGYAGASTYGYAGASTYGYGGGSTYESPPSGCTTGTCTTGTCTSCGSASACATGSCYGFDDEWADDKTQFYSSSTTTSTTTTTTTTTTETTTGCSCLWNVLFGANGCTQG